MTDVPMPEVQVKLLRDNVPLPQYMTDGAAAIDLTISTIAIGTGVTAPVSRRWFVSGDRLLLGFGVAMAIPRGWAGKVMPRSSTKKMGLTLQHGLIDSDYRGEIQAILEPGPLWEGDWISVGDRLAQMYFTIAPRAILRSVAELPPTARGEGGFGSTGR